MKRDRKQFPNDGDGDVLWQLRTDGDALADPRLIDFSAIFPSKAAAGEFVADLGRKHRVELERLAKEDQADGFPWHVLVYLHEIPKHARIVAFITTLTRKAEALAGRFWGWSANIVPSKDPSVVKELWWVYVGRDPESGLLGSVRVNLGLSAHAPMRAVPILLQTGITYESNRKEPELKLPGKKELTYLHRISDRRVALVKSLTSAVYAGCYLHNNCQVDYFYVANAKGLETKLRKFHEKECPGRRHFFYANKDPRWKEYLNFLYPNESTMEHYRAELEELGVLSPG